MDNISIMKKKKIYFFTKSLFDIACSVMGIVFLLPVFLLAAIIIKADMPGPAFYRGERIGKDGKPFKIYKFRTMVNGAEEIGGPSTALNDKRLTKIGRFLRKYKIDELPQLINILKGEMSFVGPRPQVEKYTDLYNDEEKIILSARPGLTDYASLKFIDLDKILGDEKVDEKYIREIEPEKNRLRIKYVQEQALTTDFKILIKTFYRLLTIKSL